MSGLFCSDKTEQPVFASAPIITYFVSTVQFSIPYLVRTRSSCLTDGEHETHWHLALGIYF